MSKLLEQGASTIPLVNVDHLFPPLVYFKQLPLPDGSPNQFVNEAKLPVPLLLFQLPGIDAL